MDAAFMLSNNIYLASYLHTCESYLHIAYSELEKAIGKHVLCLPVRAIAYAGHETGATEPAPHTVVNSLRLPPVALYRTEIRSASHSSTLTKSC